MSHFTTIQTQIRDLDALNDACAEMDLKLVPTPTAAATRASPARHHTSSSSKAPTTSPSIPHPENDGSYGLTTDWWDGHVAKEVGIGYGRLLQSYGIHKTIREARSRGLRTTRRQEADGSILLTLEGGSL